MKQDLSANTVDFISDVFGYDLFKECIGCTGITAAKFVEEQILGRRSNVDIFRHNNFTDIIGCETVGESSANGYLFLRVFIYVNSTCEWRTILLDICGRDAYDISSYDFKDFIEKLHQYNEWFFNKFDQRRYYREQIGARFR